MVSSPGGFEPGGFEPGGFDPGGFEPGGFELDGSNIDVKGKGKATDFGPDHYPAQTPEENGNTHRKQRGRRRVLDSDDEDGEEEQVTMAVTEETHPGNFDVHLKTPTPEPGGFDIEPAVPDPPPPTEEIAAVATATEAVVQAVKEDAERGGSEADINRGGVLVAPGAEAAATQESTSSADARDAEEKPHRGSGEDTDLDDAPSDVTEEMYMDEDGSLIE